MSEIKRTKKKHSWYQTDKFWKSKKSFQKSNGKTRIQTKVSERKFRFILRTMSVGEVSEFVYVRTRKAWHRSGCCRWVISHGRDTINEIGYRVVCNAFDWQCITAIACKYKLIFMLLNTDLFFFQIIPHEFNSDPKLWFSYVFVERKPCSVTKPTRHF